MSQAIAQISLALTYYAGLVVLMRVSGKRLAGQTTTFDLIVLICLGVVLQDIALRKGTLNAWFFIVTVFSAHRGLASWCARSRWVRRLARGSPRPLVRDGQIDFGALEDEALSPDDLMAGLRKLGYATPDVIHLAVLEETGQISAIPRRTYAAAPERDAASTCDGGTEVV
ncbi:MAG TPA: YetF domain-containing protein [Polyangiales bacterium]